MDKKKILLIGSIIVIIASVIISILLITKKEPTNEFIIDGIVDQVSKSSNMKVHLEHLNSLHLVRQISR